MIPGMQGIDHVGLTVPDMELAHDFLVRILGAVHVYSLPGKRGSHEGDDWMSVHLGVHPHTQITDIRFYRLGNGANLEVFTYDAADGQQPQPRNSDIGGQHLALYVEDMEKAVDYLRSEGVELMGDAVRSAGPALGQSWQYFRSPWGQQFELVSFPGGKAYEAEAEVLLWHPRGDGPANPGPLRAD